MNDYKAHLLAQGIESFIVEMDADLDMCLNWCEAQDIICTDGVVDALSEILMESVAVEG